MKIKNKKHLLFGIIIAIIIFVALVLVRNAIIKKQEETRPLNSYEDLKNAQDVIRYVGGQYIGENQSTDENYDLDIYAKFDRGLYTDETSNEEYFRRVVRLMAYTLDYDSFRIADEEKKILIAVVCNKDDSKIERTYINGYDNYYARQNSENDYEKIIDNSEKIANFNIQAPELIQLMNNSWNKNTLNYENGINLNNYIQYQNKGISIRSTYKKVFNIVFTYNYTGNVLNNINTKMDTEEIIKILGDPTFDDRENGLIGYKGKNIYAFFCGGDISIYRVENTDITTFINLIKQFKENGDVKKFISAVTTLWGDYDLYKYDEQSVNLVYSLRGIKIQFNITDKHGVIVYKNNKNIDKLKELKDDLEIEEIYFANEDLIYNAEISRLSNVKG